MTDDEKATADAAESARAAERAAAEPAAAQPGAAPARRQTKPAAGAAEEKPKTGKFTVARGRTLMVEGEDRHAGDVVELDVKEARSLIGAGFIDNPDADAPVILTGPKIQRTEG